MLFNNMLYFVSPSIQIKKNNYGYILHAMNPGLVITLDEIGHLILSHINDSKDIDSLCMMVYENLTVPPEVSEKQIKDDIIELVHELIKNNVLISGKINGQ